MPQFSNVDNAEFITPMKCMPLYLRMWTLIMRGMRRRADGVREPCSNHAALICMSTLAIAVLDEDLLELCCGSRSRS